jgi:hypothetical protein
MPGESSSFHDERPRPPGVLERGAAGGPAGLATPTRAGGASTRLAPRLLVVLLSGWLLGGALVAPWPAAAAGGWLLSDEPAARGGYYKCIRVVWPHTKTRQRLSQTPALK